MPLVKWKNHNTMDVEVSLMLSALKERYGYDFGGYARASLKRRLQELTRYFDVAHLSELIPEMLYDEAVAQTVINSISVPTSEFFRDAQVWKMIRHRVIPELDSFPWINIWQVGCGRGEETYTLAILLHEAGLLRKSRIFTSDINPAFLNDAREGCWPRHRLAGWRDSYRQAGGMNAFDYYFEDRQDEIAIRPDLKHSIEFVQHNLVEDDVFKEVQFVVCRNVLIYFGDALQDRVLRLCTRSLERGGYLLLGRSERILELQEKHPEMEELDGDLQLFRKMIGSEPHV